MKIKPMIFRVEESAAFLIGNGVRPFPSAAKGFFVALARGSWTLPRKMRVWLTPFFMELGRVALDQKGPIPVVRDFKGFRMELDIGEKTQRSIFFLKAYEEWIANFVSQIIHTDDLFIDVGANVGYYTLLAASKRARVISFEPEKGNYTKLLHNVALNSFSAKCLQIAIGDNKGTMTLHINPLNHGGHSLLLPEDYKTGSRHYSRKEIEEKFAVENLEQEVEVQTLDSIITERVRIVKMDVEGFESKVFDGMKKSLQRGIIDIIICELGNKETRDGIVRMIKQYDYRAYSIDSNGSLEEKETGRDLVFILNKTDQVR